jgi:glutathione S-transferase
MHLILGNKNYSSWSLRPWIAMKVAGLAFDEEVISLNAPEFKSRLLAVSGTGKVPTLIDGDVRVWESLAILEYVSEKFPSAKLWPADPKARAHARAIANEMHAGFLSLRRSCPMNLWRPCGWSAGRNTGIGDHFCLVISPLPTPCMHLWCRAFTPTQSTSARSHAVT